MDMVNVWKTLSLLTFVYFGVTHASEPLVAQGIASWKTTAKKDTVSKLVVTPLSSISFQYAEGIKGFNTQDGLFNVAVTGEAAATAFELTSRILSNTLIYLGNYASTLSVGVKYYGDEITSSADTVIINTQTNILGNKLSVITSTFDRPTRTTAQDAFTFYIRSGTINGTDVAEKFSDLPEGVWLGDISMEFNATWTMPDGNDLGNIHEPESPPGDDIDPPEGPGGGPLLIP